MTRIAKQSGVHVCLAAAMLALVMTWSGGGLRAAAQTTATTTQAQTTTQTKPDDVDAAQRMSRAQRSDAMMKAPTEIFRLKNAAAANDANELLTGLRLMLDPSVKIYLMTRENAIVIKALADDMAAARKLIAELDRPKAVYRLTYTVSEMDGTHRLSVQKYTLLAEDGQRVTLKQGRRIPVETGHYTEATGTTQTQMTYLDVGMNFDSTLNGVAGGAQLKSKVERSAVADEKSGVGTQDPIVQQTVLEGVSMLREGKAVALGTMDVPGGTHRLEVEATLELVQ